MKMASLAFALPILPSKTRQWKHFCQEMVGSRRSEYEASRNRLGITMEVAYLQQTPQGEMIIVYIEAKDIRGVFEGLRTSQESFDVWFCQQVNEIHGVDGLPVHSVEATSLIGEHISLPH